MTRAEATQNAVDYMLRADAILEEDFQEEAYAERQSEAVTYASLAQGWAAVAAVLPQDRSGVQRVQVVP